MAEKKTELSWDLSVVRGRLAMDREREAAKPLLSALEVGERTLSCLTRAEWRLLRGVPLIERLLEWSTGRRYQDPAGMVRLCQLALCLAQQLRPQRYGKKLLAELHVRAWTELSNAYRVADELDAADAALGRAATLLPRTSRSARLIARLAEVAASLISDRQQFSEAVEFLTPAINCYQGIGDAHRMGRALISKGIFTGYDDQPEQGIAWIMTGLKYVDHAQAPALVLWAVHSVLCNLVEMGAYRETRELLAATRELFDRDTSFLNRLRLRWLEGRIALGLDELDAAAEHFDNVRQGFKLVDKSFDAALASLDLAMVYARQGRPRDIMALTGEMIATFRALGIAREAIASLVVLRKACDQPAASAELLAGHIRSCAAVVAEAQRGKK